jgi:hypothetical protein
VHEYVVAAVIRLNEAEALRRIELLYRTGRHQRFGINKRRSFQFFVMREVADALTRANA